MKERIMNNAYGPTGYVSREKQERLNAKEYLLQQQREYRTVSYLVSTLTNICAGSPNKVIDILTGYLWDEEEAGEIKRANMPGYEDI